MSHIYHLHGVFLRALHSLTNRCLTCSTRYFNKYMNYLNNKLHILIYFDLPVSAIWPTLPACLLASPAFFSKVVGSVLASSPSVIYGFIYISMYYLLVHL